MKRYLCYGADYMFMGLHGIEDWEICDCTTEDEAWDIARELSYSVIGSYKDVDDNLRDGYDEEELTDDFYNELVDDDLYYNVYLIDENVAGDRTTTDLIEEGLTEGWEWLVDKYCVKEE